MSKATGRPGGDGEGALLRAPDDRGKVKRTGARSVSGADLDLLRRYKRHLRRVALDAGEVPDIDSEVRITPRRPAGFASDFRGRITPLALTPKHDFDDDDEDD